MRRTTSILGLALIFGTLSFHTALAADGCWYGQDGRLECTDSGTIPGHQTPGNPTDPGNQDPVILRYIHLIDDPAIGQCYIRTAVPGGFDTFDPFFDPGSLAILGIPECPAAPVPIDVGALAWNIFRSWTLDAPEPSLQPVDHGITGLPSYLASPEPTDITHSEVLPDGRTLRVRARVDELRVDWGDGASHSYDATGADPYPEGTVTHTYHRKTCPPDYRANHPSGGLCHPSLEYYTIGAIFRWVGEYDVGSGWIRLGTLDRAATVDYDVDEVRGVPVPTP